MYTKNNRRTESSKYRISNSLCSTSKSVVQLYEGSAGNLSRYCTHKQGLKIHYWWWNMLGHDIKLKSNKFKVSSLLKLEVHVGDLMTTITNQLDKSSLIYSSADSSYKITWVSKMEDLHVMFRFTLRQHRITRLLHKADKYQCYTFMEHEI